MISSKCKRVVTVNMSQNFRKFTSFSVIGDPFYWDHGSDWKDFFRVDSLLSDDERMIRYEKLAHSSQ